jgi:ABC-type phosphate transport system substrate-binding protein
VKGMMDAIPIAISETRSVTLYHVYQNRLWFSPYPEDSIEARWGLKKCEMIQARTRATQNSIAFIERTYRKKDPKYADFSVQQQQLLLARLSEEWAGSECREPPPAPVREAGSSLHSPDSTKARRGSRKCETIRAEIRATNDSIAFIERAYRKKDPEYAEFSMRQQQQDLKRLSEEWTGSGCGVPPPAPEKKAGK